MGLLHNNTPAAIGADQSRKNILESIQRAHDTDTLIYLDSRQDFNTFSVITVAPNEQVIFIKNGQFCGILPPGRHEVKSENYPVLSNIRNALSGGVSTFTCQVYHVNTSEQNVSWGTSTAIEVQDFYLGGGVIGVPTLIRGAGEARVRFNICEDDDASKQAFLRLMGDKKLYTAADLSKLFAAQISQEIATALGTMLEQRSRQGSINAISSQLKVLSDELNPTLSQLFATYGLELVNWAFYNLTIDETDERKRYLDRLIAAAHTGSYDKAVGQEILKDVATNEGNGGGMAGAGAGIGMGIAAGGAFATMATSAFGKIESQPQAQAHTPDPVASLKTAKQLLDAGLISQQAYDEKVKEIMSRL